MNLQGNKLTWLGHATFRIETPDGITIYIDPWLSNPLCPEDEKKVKKCDVLICTHGHGDHIGDAVRSPSSTIRWSSASLSSAPGWRKKAPSRFRP